MNFVGVLALLQTATFILKGVLSGIPGGAKYQVLTDGVQAAITELQKVHGTEVTDAQLKGLRIEKQW